MESALTSVRRDDDNFSPATDAPQLLSPPWHERHETWLSTGSVGRMWNKSERTIRRWCESGFAMQIGFRVWRDPKGRWWLRRDSAR